MGQAGDFGTRAPVLKKRVESLMQDLVSERLPAGNIAAVIAYAVATEGKRIRPLMCYAAADCFGLDESVADYPAVAIELVHTYSLVHDDLPAMDDDDLRRGKPTVHAAFDEAAAILTGDALLTYAFEILAAADADAGVRLAWVNLLAKAAGGEGMIFGQAVDLEGEQRCLSLDELTTMHTNKSGRMISVGLSMLAAAAGNVAPATAGHLAGFGQHIGLAFQIRDDILDVETPTEILGKPQGSDAAAGKSTFTSLLGLNGAKRRMHEELEAAEKCLDAIDGDTSSLRWVASYITEREY